MSVPTRKLAAKRFNERVKLAVTTINAFAIGIAGSAIIFPVAHDGPSSITTASVIWIFAAVALHLIAQAVIGLTRSED